MRATRILYLLLLSAVACGGAAVVDKPTPGSDSNAGAGGALGGTPPDDQIQAVDNVGESNGQYPAVPAGSSAFFWRGGLGNWFVSSSDGSYGDAPIADVIPPRGDSQKAYHVLQASPGVVVDLFAQLHHPEGTPVDLSAYAGVSFWARLDSPSGVIAVAFGADGQLSKLASVPQKLVSLGGDWAQFLVRFDDVNLDRSAVSSIDFVLDGSSDLRGLWLDELGFLCQGNCP
jgi:hypothetical protein